MRVNNNSVNFKSNIKFVNYKDFTKKIEFLKDDIQEVPFPWTIETMKTGKNLYTVGVMECLSGFVTDGKDTAMFHLGTRNKKLADEAGVKPFDINNIETVFKSKFDLTKRFLHGFILGAFDSNKDKLEQLKQMFAKYNIPCSVFAVRKDIHYYGKYSLLYTQDNDKLVISNNLTEAKPLMNRSGKGYELRVDGNKVAYTTYIKGRDKYGVTYEDVHHIGTPQDFFESQFNEVTLCDYDKWDS